jgi:hypothetical protein
MKRGLDIFKAVFRIYCLHLSAILAIWLGMYYPGLDVFLATIYLILLWEEGKHTWQLQPNALRQALVAILWQLPGFFLAGSILVGLDRLTEFAYYFVFILELWQTPVLPLISLLPVWTVKDIPVYYGLFFVMVPVLALYYCMPAIIQGAEGNRGQK